MKTRLLTLLTSHVSRLTSRFSRPIAANEAVEVEVANEALGGAFEVIDGGKMRVPFGEVPVMVTVNGRQVRGLQRIDEEAGNDMIADLGGWIKRRLVGRPIFAGHPYHPDSTEAAKWPDKRSRGSIKEIEVANDGIVFVPSYNGVGKEEVEDGQFMFHSPQWRLKPVLAANGRQEVKDGMLVFRPFSLHSAGLTNNPNIEVPPLVAANEEMQPGGDPLDLAELLTMLKEKSIIKEGDDKTAILSAITSMLQTLEWARERKAQMELEAAEMRKAVPDAANEATFSELLKSLLSQVEMIAANEATLSAEHSALSTRFESARAAHVDAVLLPLITSGKVTGADKDSVRSELISAANEADITRRITQLSQSKPKLGTTGGVTDAIAGAGKVVMAANEQASRKRARDEAVNDALAEITKGRAAQPGDTEKAWNLAASRNAALFSH